MLRNMNLPWFKNPLNSQTTLTIKTLDHEMHKCNSTEHNAMLHLLQGLQHIHLFAGKLAK